MAELTTASGKNISVDGFGKVKFGFNLDAAKKLTDENGLDEVFIEVEGDLYVAYARGLDDDDFSERSWVTTPFGDGRVVNFNNDTNTSLENLEDGWIGPFAMLGGALMAAVGGASIIGRMLAGSAAGAVSVMSGVGGTAVAGAEAATTVGTMSAIIGSSAFVVAGLGVFVAGTAYSIYLCHEAKNLPTNPASLNALLEAGSSY